jgi:hypothetical protein
LIPKDGTVQYFTDEDNVRIFGFSPVCGDGIVRNMSSGTGNEQCDTVAYVPCSDFMTCPPGYVNKGNVTCVSCNYNTQNCSCSPAYLEGKVGIE